MVWLIVIGFSILITGIASCYCYYLSDDLLFNLN